MPVALEASLYDHVDAGLARVVARLGLAAQRAAIERTYELVCRESLDVPAGRRPVRASRLNADGSPFQLCVALGEGRPSLQFLAETGPPDAPTAVRLRLARERLDGLARTFGAAAGLPAANAWLDALVPVDAPDLRADAAGAAWLGAAFAAGARPVAKLYANAKWGPEAGRWRRLAAFAEGFGTGAAWRRIEADLRGAWEPLGAAIALRADGPPAGRIYLSAYGRRLSELEALAVRHGDQALGDRIGRFGAAVLGERAAHPTRSVVCSFALGPSALGGFKLELCGHCLFDDDREAIERCTRWLDVQGLDPAPYLDAVAALRAPGASRRTGLHAYVGTTATTASVYLNPAAA